MIIQCFLCCGLEAQWTPSTSLSSSQSKPITVPALLAQIRPVGQCESFMARRSESVRVNPFCPEPEQTLTQLLARRQEGITRLETASQHKQPVDCGDGYTKTFLPPIMFCKLNIIPLLHLESILLEVIFTTFPAALGNFYT